MFANIRRRGLLAAAVVIGLLAAGLLAVSGSGAVAAAAPQQARVPWAQVGPGWELVQYTNGTQAKHAATTLYLISPNGTRYTLYTWRASANFAPGLIAWSGDKTRVLLSESGDGSQLGQLNLMTGQLTRFTLAGGASALGYTRPGGLNILGVQTTGANSTLARYSLTGKLMKVFTTTGHYDGVTGAYSADGSMLAVNGSTGVRLFSNAGGVIRQLPVPGTNPAMGCWSERWWDASTILAGCYANPYDIMRLWLVPDSGAKPTALTAQRTPASHDYGDLDAWRLTSGLYLQSVGACGSLEFNKQNPNGSITPVNVPGTTNGDNRIVTALGSRLLIHAVTSCEGSESLLWFNPGNRAEQWLLKAPPNAFGVLGVVAYYRYENAPPF